MAADERSGLERLVTKPSTRFTGVPVEQIDDVIERGLRLRVEFLASPHECPRRGRPRLAA